MSKYKAILYLTKINFIFHITIILVVIKLLQVPFCLKNLKGFFWNAFLYKRSLLSDMITVNFVFFKD